MLTISISIYLLISLLITLRYFRELTLGKIIIVFFNFTIAINILISEILNFFNQLNNPILFLIFQLIFVIVIFFIAIFPKLEQLKSDVRKISPKSFFNQPGSLFIGLLVFLILAGSFIIGRMGSINNIDSLHTHLSRIYYWLQHGSFVDWYAATKTQLTYPLNVSIQGMYLFLLGKSENLFFLVQWFSLVACLALIYEIATLLGATGKQANTVLLITLTFPVVLLQVFSLQGDLFLATLLLTAVFFIVYFVKCKDPTFLLLSTIPTAISIGSKQTAVLFLPVYIIVLLFFFIKKSTTLKIVFTTFLFLFLSTLAFSSLKYIQSFLDANIERGSMFSSIDMPVGNDSSKIPVQGYVINSFRYLYQASSVEGLTGNLLIDALKIKNTTFVWLTNKLNLDLEVKAFIPPDEDTYFIYSDPPSLSENSAWFGPLSLIILFVTVISVLLRKKRYLNIYLLISLLLLAIFFGSLILFKGGWGPNRGRYLITPVLMFMPLTYTIIPQRRFGKIVVTTLLSLISVCLCLSILVFNDTRPLVNQYQLIEFTENYIDNIHVTNIANSLYRKSLYEFTKDIIKTTPEKEAYLASDYYQRLFYEDQGEVAEIDFVNKYIAADQPLYLLIGKTTLEYALFGINKTRDLYPSQNLSAIPSGSYVLVAKQLQLEQKNRILIGEDNDYAIYLVP